MKKCDLWVVCEAERRSFHTDIPRSLSISKVLHHYAPNFYWNIPTTPSSEWNDEGEASFLYQENVGSWRKLQRCGEWIVTDGSSDH
eukprot:scaffold15472_cov117-Cylindrotheca_fusiformis.AAC.26